jgi:hypothetical protein
MKTLPFFSILLISITLAACKHDQYDVHGCGEFDSYEDVKAFCSFNNGTYWIYENQQTLERDTFTVFSLTIGYNGNQEVGFWTQMNRTSENAHWVYFHNGNHNVFPPDNNCEIRRVFMTRSEINENGQASNYEESKLDFPFVKGVTFPSYCDGVGYETNQIDILEENILGYSNISVLTLESKGFSLNPCTGETYRFQFGRGIGLISWENLDSMDGKWELIEFHKE